jgi:alpha-mannosidase
MNAYSQSVYFADGYHGGIYGHYPLWNTEFYVDNLAKYPLWRINLEIEPETWDTVKVRTPEAYLEFQKIADSQQIEFVNPTYAQPYLFNITGESIIRQFDYGIQKIHEHFPKVDFSTYSSEEPCFTSCLPLILKQYGFRYAVLKNPDTCWGGYTRAYGKDLVNLISSDGSSILTVPRYECEELNKSSVWQTIAWNNSKKYIDACYKSNIKNPIGMCYQDAGWKNGPWLGSKENPYKSTYCTWKEYFSKYSIKETNDNWHFSPEDVLVSLMFGSQVLQQLSQEVRSAENAMIMAEKVNAMNFIISNHAVAPDLFNNAWRTLMLSQHHDCWIVPYNKLNKHHTWAQEVKSWTDYSKSIAQQIIDSSINDNIKDSISAIRVINTLSINRNEPIKINLPLSYLKKDLSVIDNKGTAIPASWYECYGKAVCCFEAKVPSIGYSTYRFDKRINNFDSIPHSCNGYLKDENHFVLESDKYKITLDLTKGGTICSLITKDQNGHEYINHKASSLFNELKGYFPESKSFLSTTTHKASIQIVEKTPFSITVKIDGQIGIHPCYQFITLNKGQKRIDCKLQIDWQGNPKIGKDGKSDSQHANFYDDRYKLILSFPTIINNERIYKNAPFDVCESKLDNTLFDSWSEIKNDVVLNWIDELDNSGKWGLALMTDHTSTYIHSKDIPLGLVVQYSGPGLWGRNYKIEGPTSVNYAILPHSSDWKNSHIWTENNIWNEPLIVQACNNQKKEDYRNLISINKQGFDISSIRLKNKELYVRIFNAESTSSPIKLTLNFPIKEIHEVLLNDKIINSLNYEKSTRQTNIYLSIPHLGFKTLKIIL